MSSSNTVCALATPPGISGLAVIRLSGEESFSIADKCFRGKVLLSEAPSHTIHYGKIYDGDVLLDTVTASIFRAPHSYTGENIVEIGCHGGLYTTSNIISTLLNNGAQIAKPGEFTQRAFLNGKLDLTQVEAVADIIHASSVQGSHVAARQLLGGFKNKVDSIRKELLSICALLELELDFSHEDIEFVDKNHLTTLIGNSINTCKNILDSYTSSSILRDGYRVGLVGYPNAGKSTLFNALLDKKRSIVSPIAGTTRDYIEDSLSLNGIWIQIYDTAGIRQDSMDIIEIEGIEFTRQLLETSNLILIVNDISISPLHSVSLYKQLSLLYPEAAFCYIQNKIDSVSQSLVSISDIDSLPVSSLQSIGIKELKIFIEKLASANVDRISDVLLNTRHTAILSEIIKSLENANCSLNIHFSNEYVSLDVRKAIYLLGEITGEVMNEEILNTIFSQFCIGK
ncbi:MAG: tRNA uridine-5-carboxymethylaminomethyl(34) synthesis GTPase MnmE [Ignavibacteriae bacterium]|nr:tRNA uridine-5-carboxymethylaminomethyl(34) synthesis GTPase MnmE [Ignavibacteriota bacterium]